MELLLTLDVGTTSVKAGLFQADWTPVAFVIREYVLETPQKDYVELDPMVYWTHTQSAIRELLTHPAADPARVASITCTTQGETLTPVDRMGNPLHKAVVWLDARASRQAEQIEQAFDNLIFYQKTGLPEINGYCPVAKLLWFREERPDIYAQTWKFFLVEDFLLYQLCGQAVTNPALVCSTGYFDIFRGEYWEDMLAFCGIDKDKLPQVLPCGHFVGTIRPEAADMLGLPHHVKITTGAMDQVASAIGSGNTAPGIVTETTGTCLVAAATCEKRMPHVLSPVSFYCHAIGDQYLQVAVNQTAGIAYKWFRDEFCPDLKMLGDEAAFPAMNALAEEAPPLSKGLIFFPHMTGMQFPRVDPDVRGGFFGAGLDTGRGCFLRAMMEGVGYMLRESVEAMGVEPHEILSMGGGAKSDLWCQIKADICGIPVSTPASGETTLLGAAALGGSALGLCSLEAAPDIKRSQRIFLPRQDLREVYSKAYDRYRQMYEHFAPLFH